MTAVGKILVFMNLLLSLITSGMIVLVFTTRAKWMNEYERAKNVALVAEAAYKTEKIAHEQDVKSRDSQNDSKDRTIQSVVAENERLKTEGVRLAKDVADAKAENTKLVASEKAALAELKSQSDERALLVAEAQAQRAKVLDIQKELIDARLLATNNKIEADSQGQKAVRLLNRVEELERNNTQLTNQLTSRGGGLSGSTYALTNPPPIPAPRDVRGTVTAVATTGLIVVNIGSDSGISSGNKLFVYRDDVRNPLYLGELVVSRTEPKQAVGQFYPKPFAKPEERLPKNNDVVSTSLGSR